MARSTTAVLGHLRWRGGFPQLDEAHGVVVVMVVWMILLIRIW
ncbi:hypothetical protein M6B38_162545 [Iris pallida]|uniref:Uncharacterized protein n=1 Tax=Iris pallida TaxID=29817 RepID=A0AAX6F106_IRIPA|nr:hypothetical protein M6B38_162545 [Iris pallida]